MMTLRKINLFTPNPKGSKLIFNTPFRAGAMLEINTTYNIVIKFKQPFYSLKKKITSKSTKIMMLKIG